MHHAACKVEFIYTCIRRSNLFTAPHLTNQRQNLNVADPPVGGEAVLIPT